MSRVEELPPDQRAALSLLLRQRKSYADVAALLSISERSVHDRAHSALAILAPRQARGLSQQEREQVGDYLLSQSSVSERLATLTYLGGSEPGRAWAHAIAAEIAPLAAGAQLPDVPAPSAKAAARGEPAVRAPKRPVPAAAPPKPSAPSAPGAPRNIRSQLASPSLTADEQDGGAFSLSATAPTSSRLGGALLLTALVVAIVVAVILLTDGGGSSSNSSSTASSTSSTAKTTTTGPTVTKHLALTSPNPKQKSVGVVDVLTEDGKRAFYIEAQRLPQTKGFFYAIWLYNSHTSAKPLSRSPAVGKSHRLAGGALLPSDAASYKEILVTRETSPHPTHPGHVVLRGAFSLG